MIYLTTNPSGDWGESLLDRCFRPLMNYSLAMQAQNALIQTANATGDSVSRLAEMIQSVNRCFHAPRFRYVGESGSKLRPVSRKRWRKEIFEWPAIARIEPIQAEFMAKPIVRYWDFGGEKSWTGGVIRTKDGRVLRVLHEDDFEDYLAKLKHPSEIEKRRMLEGDWKVKIDENDSYSQESKKVQGLVEMNQRLMANLARLPAKDLFQDYANTAHLSHANTDKGTKTLKDGLTGLEGADTDATDTYTHDKEG